MTDESAVTTPVPAHLIEGALEAERDLIDAELEHEAAKKQAKECKERRDKKCAAYRVATKGVLHPESVDGFLPDSPLGEVAAAAEEAEPDTADEDELEDDDDADDDDDPAEF